MILAGGLWSAAAKLAELPPWGNFRFTIADFRLTIPSSEMPRGASHGFVASHSKRHVCFFNAAGLSEPCQKARDALQTAAATGDIPQN